MTRTKCQQIISSLSTGGLLLLGLFLWLNAATLIVHADPGDLFVTSGGSGTDCSQAAPCALQTALGQAAGGDAIYLAAGTYTGTGDAVITVTQSITIYGGWDGATTAPPARDPNTHPTTLDGEGARHVIYSYVFGITPTLDGLRITNGSATYGGGINSIHVNLVLRNCWVFGNTATQGGGIHVTGGESVLLTGNKVYSNTATTIGGGIRVWDSDSPTLADNKIYSNTATTYGGGIYLSDSNGTTLTANQVYSNTAVSQDGGGICLSSSDGSTLADNQIYDNTAGYGGGIRLRNSHDVTLVNNMVVGNRVIAGHSGSGIYIDSVTAHFFHTTLARNHGGVGRGMYVYSSLSTDSAIWLTNTILVGHTTGIYATSDQTVTLQNTLWGVDTWANGTDIAGPGSIVSDTNDWGDPAFIAPDSGDYHIASHSAAVGWGVSTDVSADIDGDPRPFCKLSDLGADESPCCVVLNAGTYDDVQSAVDSSSSPDDVVKVAGVCRGVQKRGVLWQAVFITKTLTIRGGYNDIFTEPPDSDTHPSTLDAVEQGRVVHITGSVTPTLEGLSLTNGSNNGSVYASGAHPIISNCHIFSNTSSGYGGGVELEYGSNAHLVNNEIYNNTASSWSGGGVDIFQSHDATLTNNKIYNNMAASNGGGIHIEESSDVTLINNIVVENQASDDGAGIHLTVGTTARALHTTLARNSSGNGQGIYLGSGTSLWLTNTILVSHTIGIDVNGAVTASHTLWGADTWANLTDTINSGTIISNANLYGDPAFVDANSNDYHIRFNSAARDAGVDASVDNDIDKDTRPQYDGYDVGADEFFLVYIYLPLVLREA
ncbi:MAG: hypothetical protein GY832_13935 [Chloroflexi bacterium]|nr:hypothetical protein [Chloroflexota bacterium]